MVTKKLSFLAGVLSMSLLLGSACSIISGIFGDDEDEESEAEKSINNLTGFYTGALSVRFTLLEERGESEEVSIGTYTKELSLYRIQHKVNDAGGSDADTGEILAHYEEAFRIKLSLEASMKSFAQADNQVSYDLSEMELHFGSIETQDLSIKDERTQGVSNANFTYTCRIEDVDVDTWREIFTELGIGVAESTVFPQSPRMGIVLTVSQAAKTSASTDISS